MPFPKDEAPFIHCTLISSVTVISTQNNGPLLWLFLICGPFWAPRRHHRSPPSLRDHPHEKPVETLRDKPYICDIPMIMTLKDSYFIFLDIPVLYLLVIWLVVDLPILKNMSSSMGLGWHPIYEMENNPNVRNHEPAYIPINQLS
jgi:hypothetical protein